MEIRKPLGSSGKSLRSDDMKIFEYVLVLCGLSLVMLLAINIVAVIFNHTIAVPLGEIMCPQCNETSPLNLPNIFEMRW